MKYDPNWLQKEKAKNWKRQEAELSHIIVDGKPICGKGFFSGIRSVQFPSVDCLPGCRTCREKFLTEKGIPMNPNGYPYAI